MVNRGPSGEGADKGVTLSSDKDKTNRTFVHRAIAGGKRGGREGGGGPAARAMIGVALVWT